MRESDWLTSTDLEQMLEYVKNRLSDRKLRLFAVGCCRRIWDLLEDARSREAVLVAERFADGGATEGDRQDAATKVAEIPMSVLNTANRAAAACVGQAPLRLAKLTAVNASMARSYAEHPMTAVDQHDPTRYSLNLEWVELHSSEVAGQCDLLRDIVGLPDRVVSLDPSWLHENDRLVAGLAETIYDEQAFDRLPILGDALEDAGCSDTTILEHCRAEAEHVRGCWVLDLLLGRH